MGLIIACKSGFDSKVRERGEEYLRDGSVHDVVIEGERANAIVEGSQLYEVVVDWRNANTDDGEIGIHCECPYFDEWGVCKHVWALLLELDRRGVAKDLQRKCFLCDAEDDPLDDDFADDYFDEPVRRSSPTRKKGGKSNSWQAELDGLRATDREEARGLWDAQAKQRQVYYAIDVPLSHQSQKLVMRVLQQERKRNGEFGKPHRLTLSSGAVATFDGTEHGPLLARLLIAAKTHSSYGYYPSSNYGDWSEFTLTDLMLPEILPRLAATGRLVWGLNTIPPIQPDDLQTATWDDGLPWRLTLVLEPDDAKKQWLLSGRLVREASAEQRPLSQAVFATAQGVVLWPEGLSRLEAPGQESWLDLLRRRETVAVPYAEREAFLDKLLSLPNVPQVQWPANLELARTASEPRGHLAVFAPKENRRSRPELHARVSFDYGGMRVRWNDARSFLYDPQHHALVERDRQQERQLLELLMGMGIRQVSEHWLEKSADVAFPEKSLVDIVQRLPQQSWLVEAEGGLIRRPGAFNMSVTSGVDWFELSGECDFGGVSATLPDILAAARKGERFVRLGDGTRGLLPESWLAQYGTLVKLGEEENGALKFKPTQAMLLDALLASQATTKVDRKFADYRRKLQAFEGIRPVSAPRTFAGELRAYQHEGLGWLRFLQDFGFGGCLADDMGLGKTVQVLALLESRRTRRLGKEEQRLPSLVVVPRSLIFNWKAEAARFAPKLKILDFSEPGRQEMWDRVGEHDVVLTTYGTLLRDITRLHEQPFDYAILDEAQAIKNAHSQSAKACRLLRATHRLALTGTPIENHLGELWSLIEFLNPGMLGKFAVFSDLASTGSTPEEQQQGRTLLARAIRPIVLRRTKQQVLKDLPEKTEQTLYCDLSAVERKKYNELRDYYRASLTQKIDDIGLERSKIHVLEALLRLRQSACHLGLLDPKLKRDTSAKLETLLEQLEELVQENHKALVFSQFTQLLAIVREHLDRRKIRYEYLDGQTRQRQKHVDRFQNDADCPLFLVSLKAGGRGLNLTAADYVFILDPWWNPAVEAQAIDRAHRIGQTQPVFAYRLIARDTVEEKILELQQTKRELADSIISADSSVLKNLTADDLKMLLG